MRIAIVVIRYGLEVNGGAELEARQIAERLAGHTKVEILTTCAVDLTTWENHYAPGPQMLNGVMVRRFPVASTRDVAEFGRFSAQIVYNARTIYDETQWMLLQGPNAPTLTQYIRDHEADYDLFIFFSYLYATTFTGLQLVPHKSILFPTAHDETWLYFDIFRTIFNLPRGFIFNSEEEAELVRRCFKNEYIPGVVLGVGIDIPTVPSTSIPFKDYILYLGRVDEGKKCDELFQYFLKYKEVTADPVKLVLIGAKAMAIPQHPDVVALGYMQDERFAWLKQAQVLVLPSYFESLSLVTLEAWGMGIPTLVNGKSAVLKGHCQRGNGGLYYESEEEFVETLTLLRARSDLRAVLGKQGQAYVRQRYNWATIEQGYIRFLRQMHDVVYSNQPVTSTV
ncbi:MAG: glycosyltransferase family 4 protein [Chloroflexi bacterium]|nr:glycosyltransferase family 4 protein [Chloroflexota bacterium]